MNSVIYTRLVYTKAAFRYSLSILKIYSARYVYYKFSVLAVHIEMQPKSCCMLCEINYMKLAKLNVKVYFK